MKIAVKGMKCKGCEKVLEDVLSQQVGVIGVEADFPSSSLSLSFDRTLTSVDELKRVVAALGYKLIQ